MRVMLRVLSVLVLAAIGTLGWPAAPASATSHSITISKYAFGPSSMTITAGDTVTWTNLDQAPHDVTTTSAPVAIHGSTMNQGQSWSYTFTRPGTYAYICSIHPDMKATLTVQPAPAATTTTRAATKAPAAVVPRSTVAVRQHQSAVARPAAHSVATTPAATSPSHATQVAAQQSASATAPVHKLKPLLLVAGVIAAVTTLCLLMLAARPEDPGAG